MIVLSAPNGGKASDWLRPSLHTLYRSALNGGKASDWTRPFLYQWEGGKLPKGPYQSSNGYSNGVHLLSILPAFPRVGGKLDHISSQGKEAIFAMHDTLPQAVKASTLYYKNIFTIITYLHILTINYSDAKLTSAITLRANKLNSPHYDYVIGLAN